MHPGVPPISHNVVVTVGLAEDVGVVDMVDMVNMVDPVDMGEVVEPETATILSTLTAKLTAILHMPVQKK